MKYSFLKCFKEFSISLKLLKIPKHDEPLPVIPYATMFFDFLKVSRTFNISGSKNIADQISEL